MNTLRQHVLGYATGAAAGLVALRFITPNVVDFMFDLLTLGIVWGAVKLARDH